MLNSRAFDADFLLDDLRLAVSYAARAGLLKDESVLELSGIRTGADTATATTDTASIVRALNDISALIAPITIADLRFGRDPFDPENQKRSKRIHMFLTICALLFLLLIGYFMHALRQEQDAIVILNGIQQLKPVEKLTALRKMVQYETPFSTPATLYDEYHHKVLEIATIREQIQNSYILAVEANDIPFFPLEQYVVKLPTAWSKLFGANAVAAPVGAAGIAGATGNPSNPPSGQSTPNPAPAATADAADTEPCVVGASGEIQLPRESLKYPLWMQKVMADGLSDFCFQLKVIGGDSQTAMLNASFTSFVDPFVTTLKSKASLRADWFLPFFYGLLGACVYVMRSVASTRTPAVEALPIIMRVALGGVAGIVIGWFSAAPVGVPSGISTLSLPFFLAFLAGYGIDAVFSMLDKLSRTIGKPAAAGP